MILATAPLLIICGAYTSKLLTDSAIRGMGASARAGAVAEEALSLIRVVHAFNGMGHESKRYADALEGEFACGPELPPR